jgi:hypothetical protein
MQTRLYSLRAFIIAFGIHIVLIIVILLSLYGVFEPKHSKEEAKIFVSLKTSPNRLSAQLDKSVLATATEEKKGQATIKSQLTPLKTSVQTNVAKIVILI